MAIKLLRYRELIAVLAWKNISLRYKQSYLGMFWALLKPIMLMLTFSLVRSFVGIDTGELPYALLTFAALLPWILFQESASEGVSSVTSNAALIKKIYFPREVFPITAMVTKLVELCISLVILAGLMSYYRIMPTIQIVWLPLIILYTMLVALTISFFGAASNVYYRDIAQALPVTLSLAMYASPVMYPLTLVKHKLLVQRAVGDWSEPLYTIYTLNPLAGIIDSFQRALLQGLPPDFSSIWPGLALTLLILPLSYIYFKNAERYFADII
ncbi:ABC transporter permease [Methylococcus sp. EFPC2]|uniref:ABC transporter permease n=1 Tax=Methylococcus sp. EFPC2 TaxID=2812648 RepID=UPI001967C3D5|nr:ABC transporter permease [Methylococcus sp. EFPC2]QSA95589.1 ABC transporter permease [Methylococcus sp. EFPC2]